MTPTGTGALHSNGSFGVMASRRLIHILALSCFHRPAVIASDTIAFALSSLYSK
jgi:hypothetical protein